MPRLRSPRPAYARPSASNRAGRRRGVAPGSHARACSSTVTARSSSRVSTASRPRASNARLSACRSPDRRASASSVSRRASASGSPRRADISASRIVAGGIEPTRSRPASSSTGTSSRRASWASTCGEGTRSPASTLQRYEVEQPGNASAAIDRPRSRRSRRMRAPSAPASSTCVGDGRPTPASIPSPADSVHTALTQCGRPRYGGHSPESRRLQGGDYARRQGLAVNTR
jgi:hypothetical protein